ncbi:MAG: 50S ribosomal protein L20 [Candidatus Sungbacteria bacterium RIFCSPLOWO2_01_FULL_59_16]|uniref:Large ribosomal subunit protein bL20 n=1 Tax=Candidatus Sungbacteria bacterium RIFCSPLOWO2_01_FULL_59_16 TaxID=1802280 RepID=A0A1G2LC31_9BACT|nr:MAG: 50S ribosomal protein L20 [Candidatus Sungbacteria bacterium RIFCSPLOWO2_01_FULL_59_16]
MTRVKRGVIAHKKRERLLGHAKGFKWGRRSTERLAREALLHAWSHQFRDRKRKKREFRRLWNIKINAGARMHEMSYSKFIAALKAKRIELDRKILADLAEREPAVFAKIVAAAN